MTLRIGSLFSGYEGLGMAVSTVLDTELAWVCDNDPGASKVLAHRYPGVPNLGDITAIDWAAVEPVDVIAGGYPCQPMSAAGRQDGEGDDRWLWPHVAQTVSVLRPALLFFENVRNHLNIGFDTVVRDLDYLGYDAHWTVLKASEIGAPHHRARIFILGVNRAEPCLRGGSDRRGRLHRDRAHQAGRHVCGPACGGDGGQVGTSAAWDATGLRRPNLLDQAADADAATEAPVGGPGDSGFGSHRSGQAAPGPEDRAGGHLPQASVDHRWRQGGARPTSLDGGDPRGSSDPQGADPRTEPARSGPGASADAAAQCDSSATLGCLVGAAGLTVWAGTVRGELPVVGFDGQRCDLRGTEAASDPQGAIGPPDTEGVGRQRGGRHGDGGLDLRTTVAGLVPHADRAAGGERRIAASGQAEGGGARADARGRGGAPDQLTASRPSPGALGATPRATDGTHGGPNQRGSSGDLMLPSAVAQLLPTPAARDWRSGESNIMDRNARPLNEAVVNTVDFGPFAAAVARWERVLGRLAPSPTELSPKSGKLRLSPAFVEWMMGLPAGHVTDVPKLTRNEQLRLLGNGVVPQQGAHALRHLLDMRAALLDEPLERAS